MKILHIFMTVDNVLNLNDLNKVFASFHLFGVNGDVDRGKFEEAGTSSGIKVRIRS